MNTNIGSPIQYELSSDTDSILMNKFIGHKMTLTYHQEINCIECGRKTKKSFFQGFCYPCFINSPQTSECILHPERCRAHEGVGRDIEWEKKYHLKPHAVYLAVSSAVKVGVTKLSQVPTRWINQGASEAIILAVTPNRYLAGCIEVALKAYLTDKTSWQKMLKNDTISRDLIQEKVKISSLVPAAYAQYISSEDDVTLLNYPVLEYPKKVKSLSFDKQDTICETLVGIKGQYLLFDNGTVFNIRRHSGYLTTLSL